MVWGGREDDTFGRCSAYCKGGRFLFSGYTEIDKDTALDVK